MAELEEIAQKLDAYPRGNVSQSALKHHLVRELVRQGKPKQAAELHHGRAIQEFDIHQIKTWQKMTRVAERLQEKRYKDDHDTYFLMHWNEFHERICAAGFEQVYKERISDNPASGMRNIFSLYHDLESNAVIVAQSELHFDGIWSRRLAQARLMYEMGLIEGAGELDCIDRLLLGELETGCNCNWDLYYSNLIVEGIERNSTDGILGYLEKMDMAYERFCFPNSPWDMLKPSNLDLRNPNEQHQDAHKTTKAKLNRLPNYVQNRLGQAFQV